MVNKLTVTQMVSGLSKHSTGPRTGQSTVCVSCSRRVVCDADAALDGDLLEDLANHCSTLIDSACWQHAVADFVLACANRNIGLCTYFRHAIRQLSLYPILSISVIAVGMAAGWVSLIEAHTASPLSPPLSQGSHGAAHRPAAETQTRTPPPGPLALRAPALTADTAHDLDHEA